MRFPGFTIAATLFALGTLLPVPARAGSFVDAIVSFVPGSAAGFGADQLPDIILGPPLGGGPTEGSLDVLALGNGGAIVLTFAGDICDGPGPDFTIFENAFAAGDPSGAVFAEVAFVAVSVDGDGFVTFPWDSRSFAGLAGKTAVLSHPDNGIDPFDPEVSGGDAFDLADLGLARVRFLRITDAGASIPDPGNRVPPGNSGGFDLDAVAVLHPCEDVPATATPTATATATATAAETVAVATPTPTRMLLPTATATPDVVRGDADGDGQVAAADVDRVWREHFDGDGDVAAAAGGGTVPSAPGVDANGDGAVTAADLVAVVRRLAESGV